MQLHLSWNVIARTGLVAPQETGAPWCTSSVLARHRAMTWDRAWDSRLPKWPRAVMCTGLTSSPSLYTSQSCCCAQSTQQSWVTTKVPTKAQWPDLLQCTQSPMSRLPWARAPVQGKETEHTSNRKVRPRKSPHSKKIHHCLISVQFNGHSYSHIHKKPIQSKLSFHNQLQQLHADTNEHSSST